MVLFRGLEDTCGHLSEHCVLEGRGPDAQTPGLQSYILSWYTCSSSSVFRTFGRSARQDVGNPEGLANGKTADYE
jgi:hypothetical protein